MDESRTGAPCGEAPAADGAQAAVTALAQGARSARSAMEVSAPLHGGAREVRALPADENNGYAAQVEEAYGRMRRRGADFLRPVFHLSPLAGTLADPNGLAQVGDTYHIFHLNNPLVCETSERTPCVWAHWTTRDFVRYRREPVALYPDTARDRDGVYSGSALVRAGSVYLYYTGNVRHRGDYDYVHAGREQNVMRADPSPASRSCRNVRFGEKRLLMTNDDFPARMTQHVRDPQLVGRDGATMMLLGARTQDDEGRVLVYRALDEAPAGAPSRFALAGTLATPSRSATCGSAPILSPWRDGSFCLPARRASRMNVGAIRTPISAGTLPWRGRLPRLWARKVRRRRVRRPRRARAARRRARAALRPRPCGAVTRVLRLRSCPLGRSRSGITALTSTLRAR